MWASWGIIMNGKKLNDIINDISKQRLNLEEKCNRRKIGVEAGSHNEMKRNIENELKCLSMLQFD